MWHYGTYHHMLLQHPISTIAGHYSNYAASPTNNSLDGPPSKSYKANRMRWNYCKNKAKSSKSYSNAEISICAWIKKESNMPVYSVKTSLSAYHLDHLPHSATAPPYSCSRQRKYRASATNCNQKASKTMSSKSLSSVAMCLLNIATTTNLGQLASLRCSSKQ